MSAHHDTKKQSLIKTATWYFSDLCLTFLIAFAITRDVKKSLAIGGIQQTWELFLYYFHERVWARIRRKNNG